MIVVTTGIIPNNCSGVTMKTRTIRLDEKVLEMAEIKAIKESSQLLKMVSIKEVIRKAVEEYCKDQDGS